MADPTLTPAEQAEFTAYLLMGYIAPHPARDVYQDGKYQWMYRRIGVRWAGAPTVHDALMGARRYAQY